MAVPPIWLMRQAGRYLPEYRATRQQAGSFLDLCYRPDLAEEVTLQPIRRYGFDASIVFADILLLPQALGQKLWFAEGEGPRLEPIRNPDTLSLDAFDKTLAPVYKTIERLRHSLPEEVALIGFAGAPWTVASYMIAGRGTPDQAPAKKLLAQDRPAFMAILDLLTEQSINYLEAQVNSGAQTLQIFESWAQSLTGQDFEDVCIAPVQKIVAGLRARGVDVPIIGFPRAAQYDLATYARETAINAMSVDQNVDLARLADSLDEDIVIQGNLDPEILVAGGDQLTKAIDHICDNLRHRRHIFNLGHGIVPQTPPEHVTDLVNHLRQRGE
jgi:uroporphyrinogen decarboxylase